MCAYIHTQTQAHMYVNLYIQWHINCKTVKKERKLNGKGSFPLLKKSL